MSKLIHQGTSLPDHQSVVGLFQKIADFQPDSPALTTIGTTLTYEALDQLANGVAATVLRHCPPEPPLPVAFMLDNGWQPVAAILGILKAGHIFVPMDSSMPGHRFRRTIEHSGAKLVLVGRRSQNFAIRMLAGLEVAVEELSSSQASEDRPQIELSPLRPAYIYYTSGTTGDPKGVLHSHGNILKWAEVDGELFGLQLGTHAAHFFRYGFAAARTGTFNTLLSGGHLHLYMFEKDGLNRIGPWLKEHEIELAHMGPSLLRAYLSTNPHVELPHLRILLVSGEALRRHEVEKFWRHVDGTAQIVNRMASSEAGAVAQLVIPRGSELPWSEVPIGPPLSQLVDAIVVDPDEAGTGELWVKGRHLSQGYWNDAELTASRYVSEQSDPSLRIFKTGDLVRRLPDGSLTFLGRQDGMAKIRGFRVELSDVEEAALGVRGVAEAQVLPRGPSQLALFYIPERGIRLEPHTLRAHLRRELPDYMVPALLRPIDSFPYTPTGKLDKGQLLESIDQPHQAQPTESTDDPLEVYLSELWKRTLRLPSVSATDDFFELGGDSLAAAQVMAAIELDCGVRLPMALLLQGATIRQVATAIREGDTRSLWFPIVPFRKSGSRPPFYLVHGIGGNVLHLKNLADALSEEQPVYGIQSLGLDGLEQLPDTIEEMAGRYMDLIKARQPEGPYLLGGYSFGGNVAFEMARQFVERGDQVLTVVMLDTRFDTSLWNEDRPLLMTSKSWQLVRELSFGPRMLLGLAKTPRRLKRHLRRQVKIIYRVTRRVILRLGRELKRQPHNVTTHNTRALRRYVRRAYWGNVVFISAKLKTNLKPRRGDKRVEQWRALVKGEFSVIDVAGNHDSMLNHPEVDELAVLLDRYLESLGAPFAEPGKVKSAPDP